MLRLKRRRYDEVLRSARAVWSFALWSDGDHRTVGFPYRRTLDATVDLDWVWESGNKACNVSALRLYLSVVTLFAPSLGRAAAYRRGKRFRLAMHISWGHAISRSYRHDLRRLAKHRRQSDGRSHAGTPNFQHGPTPRVL